MANQIDMNRRAFLSAVAVTPLSRMLEPSPVAVTNHDEDEAFWARIRGEFRLDPNRAFFNTGTLGSCPRVVTETVIEAMRMIDAMPTYGYWAKGMPMAFKVREKAAALLGADPAEVAITHSTTEGMNIIGLGLDLRPGDHVLVSTHEHPGGMAVWDYLAQRRGVEVDALQLPLSPKSEDEILELIEKRVRPQTRLISISHILYSTGLVMPVKRIGEIARRKGALYLVDGAHPVGMRRVDVKDIGCDFYAASGHKWLCGPRGTGLLYVRKDHTKRLRRFMHAYPEHHVPADVGTIDNEVSRLNFAWTNNLHDILGLGAAIDFHQQIGPDRVDAHNMALVNRFKQAVVNIPNLELLSTFEGSMASPLATVRVNGKSNKEVFKRLRDEFRITVKEVADAELPRPLNSIRISPHIYNTAAQVDELITALHNVMTPVGD
jgi:selenocysteine lyase/cysteine desulfurase